MSIFILAMLAAAPPPAEKPPAPPPIVAAPMPAPPVPVIRPAPSPAGVPPPPPPAAMVVEGPRLRVPLAAYVGVDDYPASALRAREEGTVRFRLSVGPDGRVGQCHVTASSGSSALDHATCRIVRSRARFTPARDSNGNPAAGDHAGLIEWRLPQAAGAATPARVGLEPPPPGVPAAGRPRLLPPTRGAGPSSVERAAEPRIPLQALITPADYPAAARRGRQQGRSQFRLLVGADGRVIGCAILVSSGSAALDEATCRILYARARFTPARDAAGRPVEDQHFGEIAWRID